MHHPKTLRRPPPPRLTEPVVEGGLDWGASGWAGLAAGAAFIGLQMILVGPEAVRRLASVALGEAAIVSGEPFSAAVFLAAAAVHIPLSLIYARIIAAVINRMTLPRALAVGALFGAAIYLMNYYLLANVYPWFALARGPAAIISHLAFGLLAAGIYAGMTRPPRPRAP